MTSDLIVVILKLISQEALVKDKICAISLLGALIAADGSAKLYTQFQEIDRTLYNLLAINLDNIEDNIIIVRCLLFMAASQKVKRPLATLNINSTNLLFQKKFDAILEKVLQDYKKEGYWKIAAYVLKLLTVLALN